jgi:autoinducer 2-degrading protein
MFIVQVYIHVQPDKIETFKAVTLENAQNSLKEPGVARFDILQQADDPTRFVLVEVYRTPEDAPKHKETAHYNRWREQAEPLMAEPRTRTIYSNVFPNEGGWDAL